MVGRWVFWGQWARREEERVWPDFIPWFWQLRGYPHTAGKAKSHYCWLVHSSVVSQFRKSLLLTQVLSVWGLGLACVHTRTLACLTCCFLPQTRDDHAIYSSLWISYLGTIWKAKKKVIKQVLKTFSIKDSQNISDGLWGLFPLPLFYQTTWLCFGFVLWLLGLCQQCLPVLLSGSLIMSTQTNPSPHISFSQSFKIVILLNCQ